MKKQLYLVLKKEWFVEILNGSKTEEFRAFTDHNIKRLGICDADGNFIDTQKYETVKFQLGYSKDAPQMIVEVTDVIFEMDDLEQEILTTENCEFVIELGKILETKNCENL